MEKEKIMNEFICIKEYEEKIFGKIEIGDIIEVKNTQYSLLYLSVFISKKDTPKYVIDIHRTNFKNNFLSYREYKINSILED